MTFDWEDRFWKKVGEPNENGCRLWLGTIGGLGYGQMTIGRIGDGTRKIEYGHRLAYLLHHGAIPAGLDLDHLCRIRACVEVAHLEAVLHVVNVRRGLAGWNTREKTHCPQGHPYDDENTVIVHRGRGRSCRICQRAAGRKYMRKRRAAVGEDGAGRNLARRDIETGEEL